MTRFGYLRLMAQSSQVRPRTGPRYEPRSLLAYPKEFGRKSNPEFVDETPANRSNLAGAKVQHGIARAIHLARFERGMSLAVLSEATGLNYQRLTRMLRGSVIMHLDDIGLIAPVLPEAFGPHVINGQTFGSEPYPALVNAMSARAQSSGGPSNISHG
jgi:hypothetical protein